MGMNAWLGQGCTHHGPLLAYTTICCPGRAPETRPEIVSTRSRPPWAAGGTVLNSTTGVRARFWVWQPLINAAPAQAIRSNTACRVRTRVCDRTGWFKLTLRRPVVPAVLCQSATSFMRNTSLNQGLRLEYLNQPFFSLL